MMQRSALLLLTALAVTPAASHAQDRLKAMPGYDQYTRMAPMYLGSVKLGSVLGGGGGRGGGGRGGPGGAASAQAVRWAVDGKGVDYSWDGKRYHFVFAAKRSTEVAATEAAASAI